MASESGEVATSMKRATTKANDQQQPEQLPCPRCDSTNTKFCYYNNYNFSQPRHFCKSCRRYWTHGGALRDIPVGGGSRKTAKRSRTSSSYSSTSTSTSATNPFFMGSASPNALLLPLPTAATTSSTSSSTTTSSNVNMCGSFTSLLNTPGPTGFLALGGFGLGLDDMGCFGLGRGIGWTFPGHAVEDGNGAFGVTVGNGGAAGGASGISAVGNAWQFESAENGFIGHVGAGVGSGGGDCFSWPDLAISTPGNGLK